LVFDPDHLPLTVPDHKALKPGLLRKLLRDADLTVGEFVELLKQSRHPDLR
jgi:hypothetical protein